MNQSVRVNKLVCPVIDKCGVCGLQRRCRHFDQDLGEAICPDCVLPMVQADLQLKAWMIEIYAGEINQVLKDLSAHATPRNRPFWNSPVELC